MRQPVEPVPQPRAALGLDQFLVRRTVALTLPAKTPLAEEQRALVEQTRVLGQRDALDDAGAPERRGRDRDVGGDIGALRHLDRDLGGLTLFGDPLGPLVTSLALGGLLARPRSPPGCPGPGRRRA